jgi:hypothetical protein
VSGRGDCDQCSGDKQAKHGDLQCSSFAYICDGR